VVDLLVRSATSVLAGFEPRPYEFGFANHKLADTYMHQRVPVFLFFVLYEAFLHHIGTLECHSDLKTYIYRYL
jgi:hypothetical protein